jgi:hypothetical protein
MNTSEEMRGVVVVPALKLPLAMVVTMPIGGK